jgi:hypothetical protein
MYSLTERVREAIHGAPRTESCAMERLKKPAGIGGAILLALGIAGFIWIFPELRRYIRLSRM